MSRRLLTIPGINTDMGSVSGWHHRLARHAERVEWGYAQPFSYGVDALNQGIWWPKHVGQIAEIYGEWVNRDDMVRAAGHSHGCGLLLDFLKTHPTLGFEKLFLIAPAAPADCEANGLNAAIERGQLTDVYVWTSRADEAIPWAPLVGMGTLGRDGPTNLSPEGRARVTVIANDDWGHSTAFDPAHVDDTFRRILE